MGGPEPASRQRFRVRAETRSTFAASGSVRRGSSVTRGFSPEGEQARTPKGLVPRP